MKTGDGEHKNEIKKTGNEKQNGERDRREDEEKREIKENMKAFNREFKMKRIQKLRKMRDRYGILPNFKVKLWVVRIADQIMEGKGISMPEIENKQEEIGEKGELKGLKEKKILPLQKDGETTITGTDVAALFPSITDIKAGWIVRGAVEESEAVIENEDYKKALRYLTISGGYDYMREVGLRRYAPRWKGTRFDLVTIGGDVCKDEKMWEDKRCMIPDKIKKQIVARVLELLVLVTMGKHVYSFCGRLYLQESGGPIGLRFTASLANLIMKKFDKAWSKLCKREGFIYELYLRYVDDCCLFSKPISEGLGWFKIFTFYRINSAKISFGAHYHAIFKYVTFFAVQQV